MPIMGVTIKILLLKKIYHFTAFLAAIPFLIINKFTEYAYVAELISLIPFRFGEHVRYHFYKKTLASCGVNVVINFGTILSYDDITIGNNVWIGAYNTFGHVDIGDYTLTAQYCHFLSGKNQHGFNKMDLPIMKQPGQPARLKIGPDVWIGVNSVIMADIGSGCVIGSGSIVTKPIPDWSVAVGSPARVIKNRKYS